MHLPLLLENLVASAAAAGATIGAAGPAPAAGASQSGASASTPSTAATILSYVRDGGILSYVLIGLSIFALALIIRNMFILRRSQFAPRRIVQTLEGMLGAGRLADAERFLWAPENRCFLTVVMAEAFTRARASSEGLAGYRTAVEEAAREEADEVHRVNDGIGIIAAVGPMLGLLGTVIGMIGAFRTIGTLQGAARSNELAVFMSMALVNTAEGLIVAIPCTIAFALFRRRIDRLLQKVGRDLERLAAMVVSSGRGEATPMRGAAPEPRPAAVGSRP